MGEEEYPAHASVLISGTSQKIYFGEKFTAKVGYCKAGTWAAPQTLLRWKGQRRQNSGHNWELRTENCSSSWSSRP
jgi:hypothetical protein